MELFEQFNSIADGITTNEAAELLDCTPRHVRRLVDEGQIEGRKGSNGRLQVSRTDSLAYLDAIYMPYQMAELMIGDKAEDLQIKWRGFLDLVRRTDVYGKMSN